MRKADYTKLAAYIRERIRIYKPIGEVPGNYSARVRVEEMERIAHHVASNMAVDKDAFLKACGIA